jgi:hypothetical protein
LWLLVVAEGLVVIMVVAVEPVDLEPVLEPLLLLALLTQLQLAQVAMVAHTNQEQVVQEAVRLLLGAHHRLRHPALFLLVAVAAIEAN